jgi:hypothetical protein
LRLAGSFTIRTRWKIRSDRLVDATPQVRLSIASLELASGLTFEQYVMRLPRCAMTVVLDELAERILLIWTARADRHRRHPRRRHHHRSPARATDRGPERSLTWPR